MFIDETGFSWADVEPHRHFLTGLAAVNISDNIAKLKNMNKLGSHYSQRHYAGI